MTGDATPGDILIPQWRAAAPEIPATDLSLDVWRWEVSDPRLSAVRMAPADRERASRLPEAFIPRFVAKHHALRRILAGYAACDPDAIVFGRSARGRPFIAQPRTAFDFNLSDSRDTVVLAVTQGGRVGVDIEYRRAVGNPMAIARRVLPARWIDELARTPEDRRLSEFFWLWTRFEACQKARGVGVFVPPPAAPRPCFGAFLAAPECSAHVCVAGVEAAPHRASWRFFDYAPHD